MIELRNWTLCAGGDKFTAPECRPLCAGGMVDSHPGLPHMADLPPEKREIRTSPIKLARGNVLQTESGTMYKLIGPPHPFFVESVLQKHGLTFNGDIKPIVSYLKG